MNFKIFITNFVTFIRVIGIFTLIPVYNNYGGIPLFIVAGLCFLTDSLDGFLARYLNTSTFFGSLFDALSDKLFLIINLILLSFITKLAIVPITLELIIAITQTMKYESGLNIKANIIGKIKMWVAGIAICSCYLFEGNNPMILIFIILLAISQIATLVSYCIEFITEKKIITKENITIKTSDEDKLYKFLKDKNLMYIWFNPDFYQKYKNYDNLKLIRSIVKNVKK